MVDWTQNYPFGQPPFSNYTKSGIFYRKVCRDTTKYISCFMRFYNTSRFRIKSPHFRIKADQSIALNVKFVLTIL